MEGVAAAIGRLDAEVRRAAPDALDLVDLLRICAAGQGEDETVYPAGEAGTAQALDTLEAWAKRHRPSAVPAVLELRRRVLGQHRPVPGGSDGGQRVGRISS